MKIQIIRIADRGIARKERLHIKALADVNLGFYVVLATEYIEPTSINKIPRAWLWLPDKSVRAGDSIIVYTGGGTPSEVKNSDGSTTHFLFWNHAQTLWSRTGECAVVLELDTWTTSQYE